MTQKKKASRAPRKTKPRGHYAPPLALRLLVRATGIAGEDETSAAYTAAMKLVEEVDHDCNPTYSAIADLRAAIDSDDERHEDAVLAALRGPGELDSVTEDHYGALILSLQHASFLLGAAYVFVVMSAIASPEPGGAR